MSEQEDVIAATPVPEKASEIQMKSRVVQWVFACTTIAEPTNKGGRGQIDTGIDEQRGKFYTVEHNYLCDIIDKQAERITEQDELLYAYDATKYPTLKESIDVLGARLEAKERECADWKRIVVEMSEKGAACQKIYPS